MSTADADGKPPKPGGTVLDITERKQAELVLEESEERFRTLVESAPEAIFIQTRGAFAYVNAAALRLFGAGRPEELLGTPVLTRFHPDDHDQVLARIRKLNEERQAVDAADEVVLTLAGTPVDVNVSAVPFRYHDEDGALVFARDVTARKQVEKAVMDAFEVNRAIVDNAPLGILIYRSTGECIAANDAAATMVGGTRERLLAQNFHEIASWRQSRMYECALEALASNQTTTVEAEITTSFGARRLLRFIFTPFSSAGAPHLMAMLEDFTERVRADDALRDSERRFRALVDSAPDGIFVQSAGQVVFVNPAMVRLLGATKAEDLLGQDFMTRVAPEYHDVIRERIARQQQSGQPSPPMDQEYLRLDGARVPVETVAVALEFLGHEAHLVFVRDMTERRRAEREHTKLEEQLRQSQKMESVGRLAGGIAHDFNNLLSVILTFTQFALEGLHDGDPMKDDLTEVRHAAQRAAGLTRQLLAFSRKQVMQPVILNPNRVLTDLDRMLRRIIGEDIVLTQTLAADLGSVKADPSQLEQVIMNLTVNARDAMPEGGRLTIETSNVDLDAVYAAENPNVLPGPHVLMALTDSGVGMDEHIRAHLFEPFFTTKRAGKGTGLGLSTVYGIVQQSGGHITVQTELGCGTTFRVYLPRAREGFAATETTPGRGPRLAGTETVLVVDDEDAIRHAAARILTAAGYEVMTAANGSEALLICERHPGRLHLVITDVVMPEMSGRSLSDRLVGLRPDLKVLYMSGYTDDAIVHHGVLDPGTSFISKPFSKDDLTAKVREVLDDRSPRSPSPSVTPPR